MSQEHQSQNHDLLTPEEAQQVIKLYAEREKKRREEAERLAAMPKLEDLSSLLNLPMQTVRDMAYEVKKQVNLPIELDDLGNEHVPQKLADLIIARAGQIEKAKLAEQERLAKMASLKDVASGLGINEDEAARLLKEVRDAMAPPIIDPILEEQLERQEFQRQEMSRHRLTVLLWLLAFIACVWIICYLYFKSAGIYFTNNEPSYTYNRPVEMPANVAYGPIATPPASTVAPPEGWRIGVVTQGLVVTMGNNQGAYQNDAKTREKLRECLMTYSRLRQPYEPRNIFKAPTSSVPYAPLSNDQKVSDMPGWAILTLSNKDKTKRIYFDLQAAASTDKAMQNDAKTRLDWLLDGKTSGRIAVLQTVKLAKHPLPKGLNMTVLGNGACIRINGAAPTKSNAPDTELASDIEKSVIEAAGIVNGLGMEPHQARIVLSTVNWQGSEDFSGVLNYYSLNHPSAEMPNGIAGLHLMISQASANYRTARR